MTTLASKKYTIWILFGFIAVTTVLLQLFALGGGITSVYELFPFLGTLAWVTMWAQYVAVLINKTGLIKVQYSNGIGRVAVLLIVMHPGLFLVQRFLDTNLLPPESYITYVGPLHAWAIVIAIAALVSFLLYDILKPFRRKLINIGVWPFVSLLQALAMIAIFVHSLTVGTSLSTPYFVVWWWILGIVLVPGLVLQVMSDFRLSYSRKKDRS
ncbi:MAG TPA: hypothetical protein QF549_00645 [Candidatus Saccharimonadaceae bacterium]|nr:hypothetical protein [Candidatus Saccharimonadaceae bacterium]